MTVPGINPSQKQNRFPPLTTVASLGGKCVFVGSIIMQDFLTGGMFKPCHVANRTWPYYCKLHPLIPSHPAIS